MVTHENDAECTVDPTTGCCVDCGVFHGEPCPACGGYGLHRAKCSELIGSTPEVTPMGQVFFPREASILFPRGCQCHDDSGSCSWCSVYYYGPEFVIATSPLGEVA